MDASVKQEGELLSELEMVREAIRAALAGQAYSIGGRTLTRQNLSELRDQETKILRDLRSLRAVLNGARSPGEAIATWYR